MRSSFRTGRRLPLALLLLSLGVAAAAIFQAQQAFRSHRATAEGLVRDYGAFANYSFRQRVAEELADTFRATLAALESGRAAAAAPYSFRVPPDGGEAVFTGAAPGARTRAWIADTVRAHARSRFRPGWDFALVAGTVEGGERLLVYAPSADGSARGFELDPARHAPLFRGILEGRPLLPLALTDGRASGELLEVQVLSPGGRVLFASGRGGDWALADTDGFHEELGGLRTRTAVRRAVAGSLVIGGLPRSRLPWLGGLLAVACGLGLVALGQLRREDELARLRSDFVASVSHELRTPLAQVRLFLETLRLGRYRTEEQREWILDNLERETTRLTTLVDNVLHFARAERGGPGGDREPVPLGPYLDELVSGFAPLAASRRVRLETRFGPGLVAPLHAESFRQVVLNLLDNAVKYGPRGQTVRVSAEGADGRVRIAVEDEGPGIDPRERDRVWEPFRRGEHAVGSVAVGSGIGLAVVREIVEWHEGTARVEDAPGGGARLVLELPGWRDAAAPSARPHPAA